MFQDLIQGNFSVSADNSPNSIPRNPTGYKDEEGVQ